MGGVVYWPDTRQAVGLFSCVRTQWRCGPGGFIGLDYAAVYPLMDRMGLSSADWDDLLVDLQVMEGEALEAMDESEE